MAVPLESPMKQPLPPSYGTAGKWQPQKGEEDESADAAYRTMLAVMTRVSALERKWPLMRATLCCWLLFSSIVVQMMLWSGIALYSHYHNAAVLLCIYGPLLASFISVVGPAYTFLRAYQGDLKPVNLAGQLYWQGLAAALLDICGLIVMVVVLSNRGLQGCATDGAHPTKECKTVHAYLWAFTVMTVFQLGLSGVVAANFRRLVRALDPAAQESSAMLSLAEAI